MRKFDEWLKERDPEMYNEALGRFGKAVTGLGVAGSLLAGGYYAGHRSAPEPKPQDPNWTASPSIVNKYLPDTDQSRMDAAQKRATEWKKRITQKQVQQKGTELTKTAADSDTREFLP